MTNTMRSGFVAAALLAVPALLAAQSHIPATGAGITVAGVWQKSGVGRYDHGRVSGQRENISVRVSGSARVPSPALPAETPPSVRNMFDGSRSIQQGGQRTIQGTLLSSGLPTDVSKQLAKCVASIAKGRANDVVAGINEWNEQVGKLTTPQIQALLSTPEGVAIVRVMNGAANALLSLSKQG